MATILVTPRSITAGGHPALERLRAAGFELRFCTPGQMPGEEELLSLLPGCVGYLAGVEPITARVLRAAAQLKVISRNGTGVDNIDLAAARACGVRVCRAEGANARSVAELTLGLLFALARSIPFSDHCLKAGQWQRRQGVELAGCTLGLVGCGQIGRMVAEMAAALGMEVIAYDPAPQEGCVPSPRFRYATLTEVLRRADFLSLHCPAAPDARPLIGAGELAAMKPIASLINTARAGLVDSPALLEAIGTGRLAGAAVDVYDQEPPTEDLLVALDRVIATPHVGAYTRQSVDRLMEVAVTNLLEGLKDE
ncbi:MAG: phosphoglycerate dehydrogenase [Thermoguttaceae bacterium]|jgi:phosphoglycerate dehydrogenase-like enzyme|nr:phosphoglycerate dehydrogenase [Thermoguttaceae bacterium]